MKRVALAVLLLAVVGVAACGGEPARGPEAPTPFPDRYCGLKLGERFDVRSRGARELEPALARLFGSGRRGERLYACYNTPSISVEEPALDLVVLVDPADRILAIRHINYRDSYEDLLSGYAEMLGPPTSASEGERSTWIYDDLRFVVSKRGAAVDTVISAP